MLCSGDHHSMLMAGAGMRTIVNGSGHVVRDGPGTMAQFAGRIPASAKVDML
jgi:hypothetical protein